MFLYGITLVPFAEEIRTADPGILSPFLSDDAVFCWVRKEGCSTTIYGYGEGYIPGLFY